MCKAMGVDLLSIAGHKLYAPKGIGVLYMRRGVNLPSVLVGAGQEHGRRPGTENVAFIVALGEACRLAAARLDATMQQTKAVADRLWQRLREDVPGIVLVGDQRSPAAEHAQCAVSRRVGTKAAGSLPGHLRIDRLGLSRRSRGSFRDPARDRARSGDRRSARSGFRSDVTRSLDDADMAAASLAAAWLAMVQSLTSDPLLVPTL